MWIGGAQKVPPGKARDQPPTVLGKTSDSVYHRQTLPST